MYMYIDSIITHRVSVFGIMHPSLLLQEFVNSLNQFMISGSQTLFWRETMLVPITGNVLTASLVTVLFDEGVSSWVSFSFFPFDLILAVLRSLCSYAPL